MLVSQKCHVVDGWRALDRVNIVVRCVHFCVKVLIWTRVFHKTVSQTCQVIEGRCAQDMVSNASVRHEAIVKSEDLPVRDLR